MTAIFLAPLYLILNGYILLWLYSWAEAFFDGFCSPWFRIPVAALYLFFSLTPLTGLLITRDPFHRILKILGNYWLGTLEYVLLFVLLFDAVRRITGHSFLIRYRYPSMLHTWPKSLLLFGGLSVLLVCALSLYGIFHARNIKVRHYPVTLEKSCGLSGLKIALIADLHLGYNSTERHIKRIVEAINQENPDLVCIAGDFFDNEYEAIKNPEILAELLASLESTYGTYGCLGNHDVSEKILAGFTFPHRESLARDPRFMDFLDSADISILEDETIFLADGFYLSGRKDPDMAKKEADTRLSYDSLTHDLDQSFPIIVMDHQPKDLALGEAAGADLILSGHTHGGQMFPASLFMPLLWENPWGIKKIGAMTSVVTSGAGVWGPAMRVGSDCEIVILDVAFRPEP